MIDKIKFLFSKVTPAVSKIKSIALLVLISCLLFMYLRNDYLRDRLDTAQTQLTTQNAQIESMNAHVANVNKINHNIQKELTHANNQIDTLSDDLRASRKRLRINATCPTGGATTRGLVDAATPELSRDAREDYLRLRREIEHTRLQIVGLQSYINALPPQCVQGNSSIKLKAPATQRKPNE